MSEPPGPGLPPRPTPPRQLLGWATGALLVAFAVTVLAGPEPGVAARLVTAVCAIGGGALAVADFVRFSRYTRAAWNWTCAAMERAGVEPPPSARVLAGQGPDGSPGRSGRRSTARTGVTTLWSLPRAAWRHLTRPRPPAS